MSCAVRYYSRSGRTRAVAEGIAKAAGVQAMSVDAPDAALEGPVDVLFVGGALYAYGLDRHLDEWLAGLDGAKVGRAVLFSTSWLSRHALDLMRRRLEGRGVQVASQTLYLKSGEVDKAGVRIAQFAREALRE